MRINQLHVLMGGSVIVAAVTTFVVAPPSASPPPAQAVTREVTLPPPIEIPPNLMVDDATKAWALKRAYQLNGNSMIGNNKMVDLTGEQPFARVVPLERVTPPAPTPAPITQSDVSVPLKPASDICRGKGKRYTRNGDSWRCRK